MNLQRHGPLSSVTAFVAAPSWSLLPITWLLAVSKEFPHRDNTSSKRDTSIREPSTSFDVAKFSTDPIR
jgi:hypothetical protein